jgi:type II secretory pathway pseudopilin PulG
MARRTPSGKPRRGAQAGFGFLTVLFLIILIGLALGQAGTLWSTQSTRIKEADLLWVGEQYRSAIAAYYEASSGAAKTWPRKLDDLVLDPRQPTIRRYLRRLYPDPVSGKQDWGLITDPETQGIRGVYSRAAGKPLKLSGFPKKEADFENAKTYSDWRFEAKPEQAALGPVAAPAAPQSPKPGVPAASASPPALAPAQ